MRLWALSVAACSALLGNALAQDQAYGVDSEDYRIGRKEAWQKTNDFVGKLNLTEKFGLVTGQLDFSPTGGCIGAIKPIPRVNFPGICLLDGPQAINRADLVSIFPSGNSVGSTWDVDLMHKRGQAMGAEFRGKGAHVQLGPSAGPLGRHGLGGRNWEGFSTDPYLAGKAMNATIHGIQSRGVQACSKHFIGNEQETQRGPSVVDGKRIEAYSANNDDRTLHELYLWPFAEAVHAGTASIMCSYNRFNGTYTCESPYLLTEILRDELGFEGYVVSDWNAVHSGVETINAGLDMNQPGALDGDAQGEAGLNGVPLSYWGEKNLTRMIKAGEVTEERITQMAKRIMLPYFALGQDKDFPTLDPTLPYSLATHIGYELPGAENVQGRDVRGDHAALIRRIGADGTVLLKNVDNALPLKAPKTIGVFGNDAAPPTNGLVFQENARFEIGTLDIGGGSGTGRHSNLVTPLHATQTKAHELDARVQYILNNSILAANDWRSIYPVPEVCLVFLNTFASESWDRTDYENDWHSTAVVENVARKCPNTIVITHSAGLNLYPWVDNKNVKAILSANLPGEESGNSIVDVLWGDVNPSGKLALTIPKDAKDDIPILNITASESTSPDAWVEEYTEGQFTDYRHFDKDDIEPLYEFGFGLSYTTFKMGSSLKVDRLQKKVAAMPDKKRKIQPGGNPDIWEPILRLSVKVENDGSLPGATVPQLYVYFPQDGTPSGTPKKVLRGFAKPMLQPGESTTVSFVLQRRDLSYWDSDQQTWVIPKGSFTFSAGFSSKDLVAKAEMVVRNK